jgi:hypothetical protein
VRKVPASLSWRDSPGLALVLLLDARIRPSDFSCLATDPRKQVINQCITSHSEAKLRTVKSRLTATACYPLIYFLQAMSASATVGTSHESKESSALRLANRLRRASTTSAVVSRSHQNEKRQAAGPGLAEPPQRGSLVLPLRLMRSKSRTPESLPEELEESTK